MVIAFPFQDFEAKYVLHISTKKKGGLSMKNSSNILLKTIFAAAFATAAGSASAGLVGDSVTASITALNDSISIPVTSPKTVGAGVEFAGNITDGFGQAWEISIDLMDMGFTIGFRETNGNGDANIFSNSNLLHISLGSLDLGAPISNITLSDFTCVSSGISCNVFGGPFLTGGGWTATTADGYWSGVRNGDLYTFEISTGNSVPEPGTMALLLTGFLGFGISRVRKA